MKTGQWIVSPDGARWFFDSGSLALDFGYTGDYGYGVPEWEHLHGPQDLRSWLEERFERAFEVSTEHDLSCAQRLRASISRIALSVADDEEPTPADIDTVNVAATFSPPAPHLKGGTLPTPTPSIPAGLSAVARDAVLIFGDKPGRIRRCGADDCALVFYDTSRPGTRRWCSMRRCGNRAKVSSHRVQRKASSP